MARKHKRKPKPPEPTPTPEQITERAADERIKSEPPAVMVVKIERESLLAPEAGHGVVVHFVTSYRVMDWEVRRAVLRGFRCFKCKDESWLN